jgi:hypothetical protein
VSQAGGASEVDATRQALLTLVLAGSPRRDEHRRALAEALGFRPLPLAEAIVTLAADRSSRGSALLPLVVRNLLRLARNHPEFVLPTVGDNPHDADIDEEPSGEPVSVTDAISLLHDALAVEHGRDPRVVTPMLDRAFDSVVTGEEGDLQRLVDLHNGLVAELEGRDGEIVLEPPPPTLALTDEMGQPPVLTPPPTIAEATAVAAAAGEATGTYEVAVALALGIDIEQVSAPPCEDHAADTEDGAHAVEVSWTTKATIGQLSPWTDPVNWPTCSKGVFFKAVVPIGTKTPGTGGDWSGGFTETVVFDALSTTPIVTDLTFDHAERHEVGDDTNGPYTKIWSTYDLLDKTSPANQLTFDDGQLMLRRIVYDDGEQRVWVTCTKNYRFVDTTLDAYPELACDTWFGELAIMMSTNCGSGYQI